MSPDASPMLMRLLPIMAAVFAGFFIIGLPLPVLPLHVYQSLGFGAVTVGLVAGSQFAAALVSRAWAGSFCDRHGPKHGVVAGLLAAAASGALYLLSLAALDAPLLSVAILLLGRALLGLAESFIITGGVAWGLALADPRRAGAVIAWIGTAMFAALALGAPLGTTLYGAAGFGSIALATTLLPLAVVALLLRLRGVAPLETAEGTTSFRQLARMVWVPGVGAALSSVGYGAILAFGALLFAEHGWQPVWLPFTAYAGALIGARLLFGHLPDQLGGARMALVFVLVEAAGLGMMGLASEPLVATLGAALTGLGYSLVYPGLGAEAVRATPPAARGLTMGVYTAFLDLALGISAPGLGLLATAGSLSAVFLASAAIVLPTAAIAWRLMRTA